MCPSLLLFCAVTGPGLHSHREPKLLEVLQTEKETSYTDFQKVCIEVFYTMTSTLPTAFPPEALTTDLTKPSFPTLPEFWLKNIFSLSLL